METLEEQVKAAKDVVRRAEEQFLQGCGPTEFILYAIEMRRVPLGSAVVFLQDWGPLQ